MRLLLRIAFAPFMIIAMIMAQIEIPKSTLGYMGD